MKYIKVASGDFSYGHPTEGLPEQQAPEYTQFIKYKVLNKLSKIPRLNSCYQLYENIIPDLWHGGSQ